MPNTKAIERTVKMESKVLRRNNGRSRRDRRNFYLFAAPGLIGFCILTLYPFLFSFVISFTNRHLLYPGRETFIWFKNYQFLFKDVYFWRAMSNSFYYAFFSVVISNVLGILSALLMTKRYKGRSAFRVIYFIPSILPAIATITMFGFLFNPTGGIINSMLLKLGVPFNELPLWLTNSKSAIPTLLLIGCWGFGGKMIIYMAGLLGINRELYEAAGLDGASAFKSFFRITLPLLTPSIFYNLIMSIIGALQVFTESYVAVGSVTRFYVHYLYNIGYEAKQLGRASAMAWIMFVMILGLTGINFGLSKKYVHYDN